MFATLFANPTDEDTYGRALAAAFVNPKLGGQKQFVLQHREADEDGTGKGKTGKKGTCKTGKKGKGKTCKKGKGKGKGKKSTLAEPVSERTTPAKKAKATGAPKASPSTYVPEPPKD